MKTIAIPDALFLHIIALSAIFHFKQIMLHTSPQQKCNFAVFLSNMVYRFGRLMMEHFCFMANFTSNFKLFVQIKQSTQLNSVLLQEFQKWLEPGISKMFYLKLPREPTKLTRYIVLESFCLHKM